MFTPTTQVTTLSESVVAAFERAFGASLALHHRGSKRKTSYFVQLAFKLDARIRRKFDAETIARKFIA
jgi:hypothetical protein